MPATRVDRSRTTKVDELVAVAQRHFLQRGYEDTTMAGVAKQVGVASNVVYWYFASKDHLFVAALERLIDENLIGAVLAGDVQPPGGQPDLEQGLTWFVARLLGARHLVAAVHDRAARSEVVGAFHDRVHARYHDALVEALAQRAVPADDRPLVADALITAIEGLVMHGATEADARRMIHLLLERLAPPHQDEPSRDPTR